MSALTASSRLKIPSSLCTLTTHQQPQDDTVSNYSDTKGIWDRRVSNFGTKYREPIDSRETGPSQSNSRYKRNKIAAVSMDKCDEDDILPLEENIVLKPGLNRRYAANDQTLLRARKNDETRIVDQFTKNYETRGTKKNCVSGEFNYNNSDNCDGSLEAKHCRNAAERSQLRGSKDVGELLIFEGLSESKFQSTDLVERNICHCTHRTPLKHAIRMASAKVNASKSCSYSPMPEKPHSPGIRRGLIGSDASSLELECQQFERNADNLQSEMSQSEIWLNNPPTHPAKRAMCDRNFHLSQLFSLHSNEVNASEPRVGSFLGLISLTKQTERDASFRTSDNDRLPSISVTSGIPRGRILTVVRKTGTGLEIERRASTVRIPETPRSCELNSCTVHYTPPIKNRTINWVKSQRLLQNRIKV